MDDMFFQFLGSLLSLVICMAAGFVCRKARVLNDGLTSGLSALLVTVTMPCTMFVSMMRDFSPELLLECLAAFFLSVIIFLASGLFIFLLTRLMKPRGSEKKIWQFALIFANVGYVGFPLVHAFFGDSAMIYASMSNAAFNALSFTVGIKIFTGKFTDGGDGKNSFIALVTTPGIICVVLGFVFFLTGWRTPGPITSSLNMIGGMTTPVSMLIIGSLLARNKLRTLFSDFRLMPVIVFRLVVIPVVTWLCLFWWMKNPLLLGVLTIISAMPVAAVTAIFAEKYKSDSALASKIVVLSTLLCVLTMPLLSLLLGI